MLRFVFIGIIVAMSAASLAQNLAPEKGYEELYVGMSSAELIHLMGEPHQIIQRMTEEESWKRAGYKLETKVIFHIGFDEVYKFEEDNEFGLWKAYLLYDTVVYMSITSYSAIPEAVDKITIDEKLYLGCSVKEVIAHMGDNYRRKVDEREYTEIIYMDAGLRFIFVDDKLNHVYVFRALPKSEEKKYLDNF